MGWTPCSPPKQPLLIKENASVYFFDILTGMLINEIRGFRRDYSVFFRIVHPTCSTLNEGVQRCEIVIVQSVSRDVLRAKFDKAKLFKTFTGWETEFRSVS